MVSEKVKLVNPSGLSLQPAGALCDLAVKYKSKITFQKNEYTANAKSMLSVLGASVTCKEEITVFCDGPDEEEAIAAVVGLIQSGFDQGFAADN